MLVINCIFNSLEKSVEFCTYSNINWIQFNFECWKQIKLMLKKPEISKYGIKMCMV